MVEHSNFTRRRFLRNGLAAAACGASVPYAVQPGVLGAAGRSGANDRIRLGAIGVGRRGAYLIRSLSKFSEVDVLAVSDVNDKHAREVASQVSARPYRDYRRVLDRRGVDAVVTATPDHWRCLVCLHACQAEKDIYAEKPLTLTVHEGRLLVKAARKYNIVFQTGSQQRSMSVNRRGCELIRNGRIGKVKKVIAHNYPSPWLYGMPAQPVPVSVDWEMWCGPAEIVPYHSALISPRSKPGWISFRRFSGGEMTGWGSHGFDQVQWALGTSESGPVEISTEGDPFKPPIYTAPESRGRGNKVCSEPKVSMRYPGGIVMELGNGPMGGAVFIGEKGKIIIDRGSCKSDPPELAEEPLKNKKVSLYKSDNHFKNWLDCIKSRKKPVADVEIGHRSASVCHLANIARWVGRTLKWDPKKEAFTGEGEANYYLERPRRKPYQLPGEV